MGDTKYPQRKDDCHEFLNDTGERFAPAVGERQRHDRHRHHDAVGVAKSESQGEHRRHLDPLRGDELHKARRLDFALLRQLTKTRVFRRDTRRRRSELAVAMAKSNSPRKPITQTRTRTREPNVCETVLLQRTGETRGGLRSLPRRWRWWWLGVGEFTDLEGSVVERDCRRGHGRGRKEALWRRNAHRDC